MKFLSLDAWLDWQATLNPAEIDLGLDRISKVLERMGLSTSFGCPLIIVAGTNGKGSVVAMIESIAMAAGYSVASYTSPHLLRYNERIKFNGEQISDEALCDAFERVDDARSDIQLTYFEFGTLAAIDLFHRSDADLIVMEVGLGGRLDAVNIMEPDVSVVTAIDIDHVDWLGDDREAIGYEKAGIFRQDKPAICGDIEPPQSLIDVARERNSLLSRIGVDFEYEVVGEEWTLNTGDLIIKLPLPSLRGGFQIANAATAIMALKRCPERLIISPQDIARGLTDVPLDGRFQKIAERPDVFIDVAHNPQAASSLSALLEETAAGYQTTSAVVAMLRDKDAATVIEILKERVDRWYCAGLEDAPRGLSSAELAPILERVVSDVKLRTETSVAEALEHAINEADHDDRVIIFGSFHTASEAITYFDQHLMRDKHI